MKLYFLFLQIFLSGLANAQVKKKFDIFSYTVPAGFTLKASNEYLYYEKYEGKNYCQLFLYPATTGQNDTEKDFAKTWDFFARNPAQQVNDPETKESNTKNEWQNIFGAARGSYNNQMFAVTLSSFTKKDMTYSIAAVFTDKKFLPIAQKFIESVVPDEKKYVRKEITTPNTKTDIVKSQGAMTITKFTTNFDDGWTASPTTDYVKVSKSSTEVRLHYTDPALDDARPKTVDAPEYYWSKYVSPYFTVSNPQKWSGVQYPVIYFMEGNAIDRQTGKSCYVAIKIVYSGGARPIVVVALNQNSYQQQFPHPNGIDNMLNYNKFAVTVKDIAGTWTGGGGGGVEYYNAYSGTYAGMSAVSSTDEFTFNNNGTYNSKYRSARMNSSGSQFGGQDFKGNFSVTDWNITATNRYKGKTTKYNAQLIAVKNGYLLYMSDMENSSMNYTLFKSN